MTLEFRKGKKTYETTLVTNAIPIEYLEYTSPKEEIIYHPIIKDIEDNTLTWPIIIKDNKVLVGNFRVYKARELGYTHVEAMRVHSEEMVPLVIQLFGKIDNKSGKSAQSAGVLIA